MGGEAYAFGTDSEPGGGGGGSSNSRSCSLQTTVIITVLTALVVGAVVGVAVAFGRKCESDVTECSCLTSSGLPDDVSTATTPSPSSPPPPGRDELSLPSSLLPLHYDLALRPHFHTLSPSEFFFNGTVLITFKVIQTTDVITLHAKNLNIRIIFVRSLDVDVHVQSVTSDVRVEFVRVQLTSSLSAGSNATALLVFKGNILDDLAGLYYSSYNISSSETRYLVTSHLHPTEARKVFPCFDEPALKATFNVTLERMNTPGGMISLSNTVIYDEQSLEQGWVADHYITTPPMSTYLLAFVVAEFACNNSTTKHGKEVIVCARPNAIEQVEYAVSIAARVQDFFEEYYNVTYPMPRTAHVAVPDFPAGAMENWGCILYRETSLLYDNMTSSTTNKQRVATVVTHELAHMWFGDLVTPAWWDDIWLNEGFASFMEYIGVDSSIHSNWNMRDQFLCEDLQPVMQTDSLATSHPIYQQVSNPVEINELFDSISYSKGASVIRMMNYFLGDDIFEAGITNYLRSKEFNVTYHTDLFDVLSETSKEMGLDVNVSEVMLTWILQMGYPVVNMTYDSTTGIVNLSQNHFLTYSQINGTIQESPYNYVWVIPINIVTDGEHFDNSTASWLKSKTGQVHVAPGAWWIVGNVYQRYYYRVNYDVITWTSIVDQLMTNASVIPAANRAQLIDDAFSLARPGLIRQTLAMNVSLYLTGELDYVPWTAASRSLGYIRRMLATNLNIPLLEKYVQDQVQKVYDKVGWTTNDNPDGVDFHITQLLRVLVLNIACQYRQDDCLRQSLSHFQLLKSDSHNVTVDLQGVVYCYGVSAGGVGEWDFVLKRYKVSNTAAERTMLLTALACTQQASLLAQYLYMALEGTDIRRQDFTTVITNVASNSNGEQLAWDFLRINWSEIYNRFGTTSLYALSNIVNGVTESFSTTTRLSEVEKFIVDQDGMLGSGERAFHQAAERTQANIAWRNTNEQDVITWLQHVSEIRR